MAGVGLRPGVGCCEIGGNLYFLDSHRDRYVRISPELQAIVHRLEGGEDVEPAQVQALLATGLFGEDRTGSPILGPTSIGLSSPVGQGGARRPRVKEARFHEGILASLYLGLFHMLAKRISLRKSIALAIWLSRRGFWRSSEVQVDGLLGTFSRVSQLFPKRNTCLADALALKAYLGFYDIQTSLIFGIQTSPFRAHCWVQQGEVALGQDLEVVRSFHPVLVMS